MGGVEAWLPIGASSALGNCATGPLARVDVGVHLARMTEPTRRATQRPAPFTAPAHWTNPPVPEPRAATPVEDPDGLDPTRFGDWERNGIAIDF